MLVLGLYMEFYLQTFFNVSPFGCTTITGSGTVWLLNLHVNDPGWMTVVTPTDRPNSVRNRCVNRDFCGAFLLL